MTDKKEKKGDKKKGDKKNGFKDYIIRRNSGKTHSTSKR